MELEQDLLALAPDHVVDVSGGQSLLRQRRRVQPTSHDDRVGELRLDHGRELVRTDDVRGEAREAEHVRSLQPLHELAQHGRGDVGQLLVDDLDLNTVFVQIGREAPDRDRDADRHVPGQEPPELFLGRIDQEQNVSLRCPSTFYDLRLSRSPSQRIRGSARRR